MACNGGGGETVKTPFTRKSDFLKRIIVNMNFEREAVSALFVINLKSGMGRCQISFVPGVFIMAKKYGIYRFHISERGAKSGKTGL